MTEVPAYLANPTPKPKLVAPTHATPKTIRLLRALAWECKVSRYVNGLIENEISNGISQYRASEWIDFLRTLPRTSFKF